MVECGFVEEQEFERVAAEATARMTGGNWSFKRVVCIYNSNYCTMCGDCADEDLDAEANSNYYRECF